MGFKRKIYDTLKAWKAESNGKTAAMGGGQVFIIQASFIA